MTITLSSSGSGGTVIIQQGGGPDTVGWVRIAGITVSGGSTSNAVYQDAPNNTVLQSINVSSGTFNVTIESAFPNVEVNGVSAVLPRVGSIYQGAVSVTLVADGPVEAKSIDPNGNDGASDTVDIALDAPPELLTFSFTGGYPGSQTELKAGDTYQLTGTTNKACDGIQVQALGVSTSTQLKTFASNTTFTVTITIGNRGTSLQALAATARARSATTGAFGTARDTDELGGTTDGTDLVNLNNLYPTVSVGAVTYPATQGALKASEVATVLNTVSNFDTVLYDSPGAELTITNTTTSESPKTVTRLASSYNVSVNNFRITANRAANDATSVDQGVVFIANVAATLTVSEPAARLRSGGSDGTSPQDHTITISSDQVLASAPTLAADGGGSRGAFQAAFTGGTSVWTAPLRVLDTDEKGTFTWGAIAATNLSGILSAVITGNDDYVLGGFVARTLTFAAFATTTAMNVEVTNLSKLQAGIFTATNQSALRQSIGTSPSVTNGYTIDALDISPTDIVWLDSPAASANSGGTAQITNVEEVV